MSKVNEKIEAICQKLRSLETKVQALEAKKGTCASTDPEEHAKRKRRTPLSLQVCQVPDMLSNVCCQSNRTKSFEVFQRRLTAEN